MSFDQRVIRAADFVGVLGLGFSLLALADQLGGLGLLPGERAMPVFLACFLFALGALMLARCVQIGSLLLHAPSVEAMRAGAGVDPDPRGDVTPVA